VALANYLTLLDVQKLFHGAEKGAKNFDAIFSAKPDDEHPLNRFRIGNMEVLIKSKRSSFLRFIF